MSPLLQATSPPPSRLTTKAASAAASQTSTSWCWWRTACTGSTAGCYRSSPANCGAPAGGRTPSAPRTAARAELRPGTRSGRFSRRRTRQQKWPTRRSLTSARAPVYRQKARDRRRTLHRILKVPQTRRQILLLGGTKARRFPTCGGLGRADGH